LELNITDPLFVGVNIVRNGSQIAPLMSQTWESIEEAMPSMTENDVPIGLGLFNAHKRQDVKRIWKPGS
jgi:hypothetical protein